MRRWHQEEAVMRRRWRLAWRKESWRDATLWLSSLMGGAGQRRSKAHVEPPASREVQEEAAAWAAMQGRDLRVHRTYCYWYGAGGPSACVVCRPAGYRGYGRYRKSRPLESQRKPGACCALGHARPEPKAWRKHRGRGWEE